jgi:hypothetical protein
LNDAFFAAAYLVPDTLTLTSFQVSVKSPNGNGQVKVDVYISPQSAGTYSVPIVGPSLTVAVPASANGYYSSSTINLTVQKGSLIALLVTPINGPANFKVAATLT